MEIFKNSIMNGLSFDMHVARLRILISDHGAQNAIYALEKAFELESEENNDKKIKEYLSNVSKKLGELYYEIEKL